MDFFKKLKKCIFCHKKDDKLEYANRHKLEYANRHGIYGIIEDSVDAFHPDCVKERLCNPEKFSNREVDMAIDITERFEKTNIWYQWEIERRKDKAEEGCKYWHQQKENV